MYETLEQADRHISDCKRRIEEQRKRMFELTRRGEYTTDSNDLLAILIHFLSTLLRRLASETGRGAK